MKTVKTKGIIIAEKVMSDFDKMLTILTPNMGKIECVAKGSRKAQKPFNGRHSIFVLWGLYAIQRWRKL